MVAYSLVASAHKYNLPYYNTRHDLTFVCKHILLNHHYIHEYLAGADINDLNTNHGASEKTSNHFTMRWRKRSIDIMAQRHAYDQGIVPAAP